MLLATNNNCIFLCKSGCPGSCYDYFSQGKIYHKRKEREKVSISPALSAAWLKMNTNFELQVELSPEKSEEVETQCVTFQNRPSSLEKIKERIEDCCSVPTCIQTITYQNSEVIDSSLADLLYLKSGDKIRVSYLENGAIKEVKHVIKWLSQSIHLLEEFQNLDSLHCEELDGRFEATVGDKDAYEFLSEVLFHPWSDNRTFVNRIHFNFLGGPKLLIEFHKQLIICREKKITISRRVESSHFELLCCDSIASYAMNEKFSRLMIQSGGLETSISSFLSCQADCEEVMENCANSIIMEALRGIVK